MIRDMYPKKEDNDLIEDEISDDSTSNDGYYEDYSDICECYENRPEYA